MLALPYPPSANRYWRIFRGRATPSKAAAEYKQAVRSLGEIEPTSEPVALSITLHPKQRKDGEESRVIMDLDNCLKVALDALQGVAYENDRQVRRISLTYGESMPDGGLTVLVEAV